MSMCFIRLSKSQIYEGGPSCRYQMNPSIYTPFLRNFLFFYESFVTHVENHAKINKMYPHIQNVTST
jgi:hypothetical protein